MFDYGNIVLLNSPCLKLNEDNLHFTNREGNEISQPNLLKSASLVWGNKYLTRLLAASLSTCPLSRHVSKDYKFLQTGTQVIQNPRRQSMRHFGTKMVSLVLSGLPTIKRSSVDKAEPAVTSPRWNSYHLEGGSACNVSFLCN